MLSNVETRFKSHWDSVYAILIGILLHVSKVRFRRICRVLTHFHITSAFFNENIIENKIHFKTSTIPSRLCAIKTFTRRRQRWVFQSMDRDHISGLDLIYFY